MPQAPSDNPPPIRVVRRAWIAAVATARGLVRRKSTPDWVTAVGTAIPAAAVILAAVLYLIDWSSDVTLAVDPPLVVEIRCSRADFDAARCMDEKHINEAHLSVTAALRITATGPAQYTAVIDHANATIHFGPDGGKFDPESAKPRKLPAFWAANLTPGNEDRRQQIAPLALTGGQSSRRVNSYWRPKPNAPGCSVSRYSGNSMRRTCSDSCANSRRNRTIPVSPASRIATAKPTRAPCRSR